MSDKPTLQEIKETSRKVGEIMFKKRKSLINRAHGILEDHTWCAENLFQAWCYAWYENEPSFGVLGRDDYFWGEVEDYIPASIMTRRSINGFAKDFEFAVRDYYGYN